MKKKKIELKNLEIDSFVTHTEYGSDKTIKGGGGFLSIWGNTCNGSCDCSNYTCNDPNTACSCHTCGCYTNTPECTDFCEDPV